MPDNKESLWEKMLLLILGAIVGAAVTYFTEVQKFKNEMTLDNNKFKTNLITQILGSGNVQQNLDNLSFIIDAGLIDDPGGKIKAAAQAYKPKISSVPASTGGGGDRGKASQNETLGFEALLSQDLKSAKNFFEVAYKAYPTYHNIDEINRLLKAINQVADWNKEIYCPILKKYSWGMPEGLKQQMQNKSQGQCG